MSKSRKNKSKGKGRPRPVPRDAAGDQESGAGSSEAIDLDLGEQVEGDGVLVAEVSPEESPAPSSGREERSQKIKDLVRLAEEQGYLTYEDINEIIPDSVINPDELDRYLELLRSMDIVIIDSAEVEKYRKEPEKA